MNLWSFWDLATSETIIMNIFGQTCWIIVNYNYDILKVWHLQVLNVWPRFKLVLNQQADTVQRMESKFNATFSSVEACGNHNKLKFSIHFDGLPHQSNIHVSVNTYSYCKKLKGSKWIPLMVENKRLINASAVSMGKTTTAAAARVQEHDERK